MKKLTFILNILFAFSFLSVSFAQNISNTSTSTPSSTSIEILKNTYVQIIDSCNWAHAGACVAARGGPGTNFSKESRLRNGIVLKVGEKIETKSGSWYKIDFKGEKVKKDYRIKKDWYVNAKYTKVLENVKPEVYDTNNYAENIKSENKKIYINLKKQTLEAYDGNALFMKTKISTGLKDTPTENGEYFIHYKTPSRYMQDDATSTKVYYTVPSMSTSTGSTSTVTLSYSTTTKNKTDYKEYYDLPGVPFTMFFDEDGKAIHGAYWHNDFGNRHSHGCINLSLKDSEKLYYWAPVGAVVIVK